MGGQNGFEGSVYSIGRGNFTFVRKKSGKVKEFQKPLAVATMLTLYTRGTLLLNFVEFELKKQKKKQERLASRLLNIIISSSSTLSSLLSSSSSSSSLSLSVPTKWIYMYCPIIIIAYYLLRSGQFVFIFSVSFIFFFRITTVVGTMLETRLTNQPPLLLINLIWYVHVVQCCL